MKCKLCSNKVKRVDVSSKSVICWECTHLYNEGYSLQEISELGEKERNVIFVR